MIIGGLHNLFLKELLKAAAAAAAIDDAQCRDFTTRVKSFKTQEPPVKVKIMGLLFITFFKGDR